MSTEGCNELYLMENGYDDVSPIKADANKQTAIILVKGVSSSIREKDMYPIFNQYGIVRKIISKPSTLHYYIEYDNPKSVDRIQHVSDTNSLYIGGKNVKIMRINKIPLDLNEPSKVVLITFLECQEIITIDYITELLKDFGAIEKVSVFSFMIMAIISLNGFMLYILNCVY